MDDAGKHQRKLCKHAFVYTENHPGFSTNNTYRRGNASHSTRSAGATVSETTRVIKMVTAFALHDDTIQRVSS